MFYTTFLVRGRWATYTSDNMVAVFAVAISQGSHVMVAGKTSTYAVATFIDGRAAVSNDFREDLLGEFDVIKFLYKGAITYAAFQSRGGRVMKFSDQLEIGMKVSGARI